jgi:hypothetical protein
MKPVEFILCAAMSLAAMGAQADATFALHVQGEASVWSLESGETGVVPWFGTLTIQTPGSADGVYSNPNVAFESNLALTGFDTSSQPFPAEEISVTVQGGKVTSVFGGYVDADVVNGYFLRNVFFSGDSLSVWYYDRFNLVDAKGALAPVDEPGSISLVLAGLAATGWAIRRRAPART